MFKGKNKNVNLLLSFVINTLFLLLVMAFCDMKYEVSDDFIVDSILSGAYGNGYDEHLLFSNILYGYFLKALYILIPYVSWYFIMQIVICFCSLWAVTYVVLQSNNKYVGLLLAVIFVSFFSDDLYILVQFTKTAAVAMCAGGSLFLYGMSENKKTSIIFGGGLAVVGSLIRFKAIYIALVFLLLIFLKFAYYYYKTTKKYNIIIKTLIVSLGLIGCAFLLDKVDSLIWNSGPEYGYYKAYNEQRAAIVDVTSYGYDSIKEELKEIGISENDYDMLNSWNFLDQDYFTIDKLEKVAQAKREFSDSATKHVKYVIKQFFDRHYEKYTVTIGMVVLLLCAIIIDKIKIFWYIITTITNIWLLMYFIYSGRVVYRVEYAIFACAAICMIMCPKVEKEPNIMIKRAIILALVAIGVCKIPLYIPDESYKNMDDEQYAQYIYDCFYESWDFKIEKYRCCVSKRRPHNNLLNTIENDTQHYYLIDFNTGIQLIYYNYKPWIRVPANLYDKYSYFGGVTIGYPDNYNKWNEKGIDGENPYKTINNENLLVIDSMNYDMRLGYIRDHYNHSERKKFIQQANGFDIWKYDTK